MRTLMMILPLAAWALLWGVGGWLLIRGSFHASRPEQVPLALIVGLCLENLFANMLAMVLPVPLAFWLAAGIVLLLGIILAWGTSWRDLQIPVLPGQWLALLAMFGVIFLVQRGLAIFDDYAHLPTVSLMATGDIPPHFALDGAVPYAYHYFLLLFGAQIMRLGGIPVYTALDIARAFAFALTALLVGVWVQRLTRSQIAGALAIAALAFGSGTRWLLLFLPPSIVQWLSHSVTMIGSGASSGPDLATALASNWAVEGAAPIPFPFAFANGIYAAGILGVSGPNSVIGSALSVFFLQTFNHWRSWRGGLVTVLMIATQALLTEFSLLLELACWGGILLIYLLQHRTWKIPVNMRYWLVVIALGNLLGLVQGGALSDIILGWLRGLQGQSSASYQTVGAVLSLSPAIVSAHLGVLYLTNLPQLIVALLEIGPILLVTPLLAIWGWKAYRYGRWYEAVLILSGFLTFATVFVQFSGSTGVRNTSRLYSIIGLNAMYVVPLLWLWVARRSQTVKLVVGMLGGMLVFGGLVIFAIELTATQRPVTSYFITPMDSRISQSYWNRLEPGTLVFDSEPSRATTLLGRPTNSSYTWYKSKPEWQALRMAPDPHHLLAAGFRYAYLDNGYWDEIGPQYQQRLSDPCVLMLNEQTGSNGSFRRLLDLEACR